MPSLIGTHTEGGFSPFMDNHIGGFRDFEAQMTFLHEKYFPRVVFSPVYLSGVKTHAFCRTLDVVGFTGSAEGLWPSARHCDRLLNWPVPKNREELDAFLW